MLLLLLQHLPTIAPVALLQTITMEEGQMQVVFMMLEVQLSSILQPMQMGINPIVQLQLQSPMMKGQ